MGLTQYQKDLLKHGIDRWKWASGATRKRHFGQVNISDDVPVSERHGRRPLGRVDVTDLPKDLDLRKIMPFSPIPQIGGRGYICKKCGNILLHRPQFCGRCGHPTPVDVWLSEEGRR